MNKKYKDTTTTITLLLTHTLPQPTIPHIHITTHDILRYLNIPPQKLGYHPSLYGPRSTHIHNTITQNPHIFNIHKNPVTGHVTLTPIGETLASTIHHHLTTNPKHAPLLAAIQLTTLIHGKLNTEELLLLHCTTTHGKPYCPGDTWKPRNPHKTITNLTRKGIIPPGKTPQLIKRLRQGGIQI